MKRKFFIPMKRNFIIPWQEPIKIEPEDEKIMMETTLYMLERFKGGKHGEITKNAQ